MDIVAKPTRQPFLRRRFISGTGVVVLGLLALLWAGCRSSHYRQQADAEVYSAIAEKGVDPRWALTNFSVEAPPASRLTDSQNKDQPPPPPDDPAAHAYLKAVDGKRGSSLWEKRGAPVPADDGSWRKHLEYDIQQRLVLNVTNAMRVGLLNSRTYQQEREDLYLAALDVTYERFSFDTQLGLGSSSKVTALGPDYPGNTGDAIRKGNVSTKGTGSRLLTTGGEMLIGLANELVWNIKGPGQDTFYTVFNFSFLQPLLRGAGRAKVLERLTLSERRLLANVRQMCQYQQGFTVELLTGRTAGEGPNRRGAIGAGGLGLIAGTPTGRTGAPDAGGFLGLMQEAQLVLNSEANVAALRSSHAQLQSAFEAGRLPSRLQVDQALVALYRGQSSLLSTRAAYKTRVDSFKVYLGLPPDMEVAVRDPFLSRFTLMDPEITALQNQTDNVAQTARDRDRTRALAVLKQLLDELRKAAPDIPRQWAEAQTDVARFRAAAPARKLQLRKLLPRPEVAESGMDPRMLQPEAIDAVLKRLDQNMARIKLQIEGALADLEKLAGQLERMQLEEARDSVANAASELSSLLLELSLNQAGARLQTISFDPVELTAESAVGIARENRLDWMNARSQLVDAWRQIEVDANDLKADLDLTLDGDMRTRGNNPVNFDPDTGSIRAGLHLDTPVNRTAERNAYRETLIAYQKARRDYMLFEDRVVQSLRNTTRLIDLSQVNFEIRRAAVEAAIRQVDLARLRLTEPPRPGALTVFGATTARDLLTALSDLLDAQNDFLKSWVNDYMLRMVLDFELGTMRLDANGLWVDPGPMTFDRLTAGRPNSAAGVGISKTP